MSTIASLNQQRMASYGSKPQASRPSVEKPEEFKTIEPYKALFREFELETLIKTLNRRKKANATLVGEAGVGKTTIVNHLALLIEQKDPKVLALLGADVEIYELPLQDLMSGKGIPGSLEKTLSNIVAYAEANNVILFIDEIHQLFTAPNGSETTKVSQILKPFLAGEHSRVIGATTTTEYNHVLSDPAFVRRSTVIPIGELTSAQTQTVVIDMCQTVYHDDIQDIDLTQFAKDIVSVSERNKRSGDHQPDAALTLLDTVMSAHAYDRLSNDAVSLSKDYIERTAQKNTNNLPDVTTALNRLKKLVDKRPVIENEVETLERLIRNYLNPLFRKKQPNVLIVSGAPGSGATTVVSTLAKAVFGDDKQTITLDMADYAMGESITNIIGVPAGYKGNDEATELPLDGLQTNTRRLVVLDHFDKAHPDIQRFFLNAIQKGSIRLNRKGLLLDLSNAIFALTTSDELSGASIGFTKDKSTKTIPGIPERLQKTNHVIHLQKPTKAMFEDALRDCLTNLTASLDVSVKPFTDKDIEKLMSDYTDDTTFSDIKRLAEQAILERL